MSRLGSFFKQPVEVEVYSIAFELDMSDTDEITSAFTMLSRSTAAAWDQVVQTSSYTTLATDDGRILVATANVVGYTSAVEGYMLYVSNQSQGAAITVCGFSVPARGSIVVVRQGGAWVKEASTTGVLINAVGDQRVRTFLSGGVVGLTYKAQVTVTTTEGRTMQDEFLVRIKEV